MRLLVLTIFAVAATSAVENFDGPEWQPIDFSRMVPVHEIPGFWDGTVFEKSAPKSNARASRIVGGQEVTPHTHPYQVFLAMQGLILSSACGGTVIRQNLVMSAAHCFSSARTITIVAGAHNVRIIEDNQQRRTVDTTALHIHPAWSRPMILNDVAVIVLQSPFTFNDFVQAVAIPAPNAGNFVGEIGQSTGWGRVADNQPAADVLRSVTNRIVDNSVCEAVFGDVAINQDTVCIDTTGGRGVCSGDSGGPLTVLSAGERLQVGIASFVHSAGCESGFPHVFERVSSHRAWINNYM